MILYIYTIIDKYYRKQGYSMDSMVTIIGTGFVMKLVQATIAIVLGRYILAQMDKRVNFNFKEWINDPETDKGVYLAARCMSVFGVLAFILS